jgi:phosphocarrier protein HPr
VLTKEITVVNRLGLHARAAAKLVSLASQFASHLTISKGSRTVNCKSIMGVMMLAASKGTVVSVSADGADEADALEALERLFADRFGEAD